MYWLASYPKSGNTWFRILYVLAQHPELSLNELLPNLSQHAPWEADRLWFEPLLHTDWSHATSGDLLAIRHQAQTRLAEACGPTTLVKTHHRYGSVRGVPVFSGMDKSKAVLIVRNPLDIAVSLKHHTGFDEDSIIRSMINPGFIASKTNTCAWEYYSNWRLHLLSWLENAPCPVHVLHYEQLVENNPQVLCDALAFIDIPITKGQADDLYTRTELNQLKQSESEVGFSEIKTANSFFRKGSINGWKNDLRSR